MRILLANGALHGGGAERVLATLATQVRARGHTVTIATLTGRGEILEELVSQEFDVRPLLALEAPASRWNTARRIAALVRETGAEIVHTHDLRSEADVGAARRLYGGFRHVHTFHFGNYPAMPLKMQLLEAVCARLPDLLVAVGHKQRETIIAGLSLPARHVLTVWNGVNAPVPSDRPEPGHGSTPLAGSISSFFAQKGLPTLLDALGQLRARDVRFSFLLVGDGPLRPQLEAQLASLGLGDAVTLTGWHRHASQALLPTLDVFVQSSLWEAMSLAILEAMAAGRAIVATRVGENPVVLEHEHTALLVPPGDPAALADALERLLTDAALRQRLGRAARAAYVARYSAEMMAETYLGLYARLVRGAA